MWLLRNMCDVETITLLLRVDLLLKYVLGSTCVSLTQPWVFRTHLSLSCFESFIFCRMSYICKIEFYLFRLYQTFSVMQLTYTLLSFVIEISVWQDLELPIPLSFGHSMREVIDRLIRGKKATLNICFFTPWGQDWLRKRKQT